MPRITHIVDCGFSFDGKDFKNLDELNAYLLSKEVKPEEVFAPVVDTEKIQKLKSLGYSDEDIKAAFRRKGIAEEKVNEILSQTKTENDALQKSRTGEVLQRQQEQTGETGSERSGVESVKQGEEAAGTRTEEKQQEEVGGEGRLVGGSHRSLTKLATDLGLPKPERGQVLSPEEYTKRGEYLVENGADPQAIADEFERTGKVNAEMISVTRAHLVDLVRDAEKARKEFGIKSDKFKDALQKVQDWSENVMKPMGTKFGEVGRALQGDTDMDTGNFISVQRAFEDYHNKPMTPAMQEHAEKITAEVDRLNKEVEGLKKKVTEALDKGVKEEQTATKKTYAEKAKKVADNFRKLKTKPFKFTDENGNEHDVNIQGITWNDLVEIGAKAIEKTGEIADGVSEILDKIKDVDWYKKLSDKDKYALEKQLEQHYKSSIEDTPEAKNIRRLEKKLEDYRARKIPETKDKRPLSEVEKDLHDQIFEEKKKLGLIRSKKTSDTDYGMKETPESKNLKRLQDELDELKKTGKLKDKQEQRETTDSEKFLKQQIETQKDNIKFKALSGRLADKKDNKFPIEDVRDIWDYAKKQYIDKGADYGDMINGVATDMGLTPEQVGAALTSPKGVKPITDEMYRKQYERNKASQYVEDWVKAKGDSAAVKFIKGIPRFFFGLKVFGHGTVGFITHAGINIFDPLEWKRYFPASLLQFKFAYGDIAKYEQAMENLQKDPQYIQWKKAGLAVDPSERYDDYQFITKIFNKLGTLGKWLTAGDRGFNALKVYRLARAKALWNSASAIEKADPGTPKEIARLVNHSTGTSHIPLPEGANVLLFAPRLEASRWDKLLIDPARAARTATNWKNATPSEKLQAKIVAARAGRILGTYVGALVVNQALLSLSGSNQKINYTDPTQSDFMKFKVGDRTLDLTGGMISVFDFVSKLIDSGFKPKEEVKKSRTDEIMNSTWYYATGKLSPFGSTVKDLLTKHDYAGNTLPFSGDKPLHGYNKKLTWKDYLTQQQLPIPASEFFTDMGKHMESQGLSKPTTQQILGSLFVGALVGGTGVKIGEEPFLKANPTFTKEDKAIPAFKYFVDKGIELPNTSSSSEKIKDQTTNTIRKLDDYPKETVDKYNKQHKENLKDKLQLIEDRDYVFINKYGEIAITQNKGYMPIELKKLTTEQLHKVLSLAQSSATTKTKKEIFGTEEPTENE